MHLEPGRSQETSASDLSHFETELIGREDREDRDDNDEKTPAREGLPKRFRMRHGRHYVDELLGDAPLRTVREIPISEIEPPPDEAIDLEILEASIRQLGVIEPILVGRPGAQYRVITGMRRLRAARTVGLSTVPCLVQDVDDQKLSDMREAATTRLLVSPPPHPEVPEAAGAPTPFEAAPPDAVEERLRLAVLADLVSVERLRAKTASTAADTLTRSTFIERTPVSCAALIADAASAVAVEARLRGTRVDVSCPHADCLFLLDGARCRAALTGLLQSLLALTSRAGTTLDVRVRVPAIRPALVVECQLREIDHDLSDEAVARFFEAGWQDHPCGTYGGTMLAALAQTARAHGGRVDVKAAVKGCVVTFVVPRLEG